MKTLLISLAIFLTFSVSLSASGATVPIRVMVITGGHSYTKDTFNEMLNSLGPDITYEVAELPAAYELFLPENRARYDVLVFYHMWQKITPEEEKIFADCIREGKPVVALHHSICAFDDWAEYWNILGGKYFHKPTTVDGKEYAACTYIHDLHFVVNVKDKNNPVTKGVNDFEIFDESYKGYYVAKGVNPILTTTDTSSTPVIGWTKKYGNARIVVLQSGHATPTFQNPNFRKLLRQSIEWAFAGIIK